MVKYTYGKKFKKDGVLYHYRYTNGDRKTKKLETVKK